MIAKLADAGGSARRACRIARVDIHVVGMRWRNGVFAHVHTDDGIDGVGEGSLEYQPQAVATFVPPPAPGAPTGTTQINDVFVDEREIVYCVDRHIGGLYCLEMDF